MYTLNCNGNLIDLSTPKVMGIINVTPDSFYDGGRTTVLRDVIAQATKMLKEGATFLDIGGYSSRPNATHVSEEEEIQRVIPAIKAIIKEHPQVIISIDTFRSNIAKIAVEAGAAMINDISAGMMDTKMLATVANLQVPYAMMHIKGTPQTMSKLSNYENITKEVLYYFSERISAARKAGINDLIVDPGFGFAKNTEQNFELLQHLSLFKTLETPVLVGVSRKSMIYKTLETNAENALNGTTSLHTVALLQGANLLRVHDVKEAMECVTLIGKITSY